GPGVGILMSGETRVILGFIAALAISLPLTELARLLAMRTGFYDHPVGYKLHRVPTPYLGGLAVVSAALLASVVFADALGRYLPLSLAVVALLALGTLDDRVGLGVVFRFAVQIAAGVALWFAGLGWQVMPGEVPDLV